MTRLTTKSFGVSTFKVSVNISESRKNHRLSRRNSKYPRRDERSEAATAMDYVYLMLSMLTRYTTGLVYSITQRDFCQAMLKIKAALTMIKNNFFIALALLLRS